MKYTFKQAVDDFGPVLAGFQIVVSIVSIFGIGAFASWIIEHWLPFTRWIWTNIISYIQFPDTSDPEKDALTAIAFFTPIAISAFLNKILGDSESYNDESKLLRVRIFATIIGVVCMYIVGSRVVIDMFEIVGKFGEQTIHLILLFQVVAVLFTAAPIFAN